MEHDGKLVTVFSAPNYCDQMGNKGAIIKFNCNCEPSYIKFTAVHTHLSDWHIREYVWLLNASSGIREGF